ncbi:hypothetical protein SAMN05443270_1058 [Lacrimispora sphenoides]|uniref:hypothetical protein n=1 Tax=Lacrimispora sphenoides TaxID=29370 RepID=UPI0008B0DB2B|nr:hypothetical protein [Lacrimispora sphenoides]SET70886.1 hypothetical protein SAMN05443270_1058 [Lacrimispora sphenoides]
MGEGFIMRGGNADLSDLTALPSDVVENQKFYGVGSEEVQDGAVKNNGSIKYKLPINATYTIPAGYHDQGEVYQDTQIITGDIIINPQEGGSAAGIKDKFFNSDVVVNGVENLLPENIKAGVFIGTIEGTWSGFVNGDPLQPYWYGLFAPGQTGRMIANRNTPVGDYQLTYVNWSKDDTETGGEYIWFRSDSTAATSGSARNYPAITFKVPIEMAGVKSVTICYKLPSHSANSYTWLVFGEKEVDQITNDNSWTISPNVGAYEKFVLPATGDVFGTQTFSLINAASYHYIYVGIGVAQSNSQGRFMMIRYIKLNK